MLRGELPYPRGSNRVVKELWHSVMLRILADPIPDQHQAFFQRVPVNLEPREAKIIAVAERRIGERTVIERGQELVVCKNW